MNSPTVLGTHPVPTVVEKLEHALAEAKSGRLRTALIVGRLQGGDYYTAFDTDDIFTMISTIELAKFDLLGVARKVDPR